MFLRSTVLKVFTPLSGRAQFSTSLPNAAAAGYVKKSVLKIRARERREINELKQKFLSEKNDNVDPVLGLPNNPFLTRINAEAQEPNVLGKGYKMEDVEKLLFGAQQAAMANATYNATNVLEDAERQREAVLRVLNMKNRSDAEILKFKTNLVREEFQRFEGDTGSSEVQAAIATVKIHHIYQHCQENKKDFQNVRLLRMLVQKRQRLLRYLKRDQPQRYYWAINKLGLTDHVIHTEFNMDRAYMQKFKMYGDRVLVKESKRVKEEVRREKRKENKILKRKSLKELRSMKKSLDSNA